MKIGHLYFEICSSILNGTFSNSKVTRSTKFTNSSILFKLEYSEYINLLQNIRDYKLKVIGKDNIFFMNYACEKENCDSSISDWINTL